MMDGTNRIEFLDVQVLEGGGLKLRCRIGDKVVRIQGQCSCICAPGYKGDPPDCKQDCPVCPCNIIGTAGTLQCDLVNLKQLDVPVGTTLACITPEYPVQHTWMNKVYCCPNYQPLPNGLCSDSKY